MWHFKIWLIISVLFLLAGPETHIEKEEHERNVITKRCGVDWVLHGTEFELVGE